MTVASTHYIPDALDERLFAAFPGLVIRKDLTHEIRGMSKAPSYVIEFMLGKYCANLFNDEDVREGLRLVQEEVARYIPRGDETEVIKSQIKERPPAGSSTWSGWNWMRIWPKASTGPAS